MRTYKTTAGMRSRFLEVFQSKSIPAHTDIGMKILGLFHSIEDPDTFFFMRGFPDLASRERMKAKFYEGALWKQGLENVLMPMLEKYDVVLAETAKIWFIAGMLMAVDLQGARTAGIVTRSMLATFL